MVKKGIAAAVVVLALGMVFQPALAAIERCTVDVAQERVFIQGSANAGDDVLLTVVKKAHTPDTFFEDVAYQDQSKAGEDGAFAFDFKMSGADLYTAVASTATETFTYDFVFSDSRQSAKVIEQINAAASQEELRELLEQERYGAGLFVAECDAQPNYPFIAGVMMEEKPYDTAQLDAVLERFKQYLIYGYIKDGVATNLFDFEPYLHISQLPEAQIFTPDIFGQSHQIEVTKRMNGNAYRNDTEFTDALTEQMALALIMDPDGFGNVELVCQTFADRIGIDASRADSAVYRKLSGESFADFGKLKARFNELVRQDGGHAGTGSGGGSGGGGSSSGGSGGGLVSSGNPGALETVPVSPETDIVFADLGGYEWAVESIQALYEKGIVSGRAEQIFAPADAVTRSEFVKLVVLAFGIQAEETSLPFTDVADSDWAYPYICTAYGAGMIQGISETEFGASTPISRQDMAVIVQRAAGLEPIAETEKFADDQDISAYAYDAVYALQSAGVMIGDEQRMFYPKNYANRAEAAKVIYMAIQ